MGWQMGGEKLSGVGIEPMPLIEDHKSLAASYLRKNFVRCGIRTHALNRGPEISSCPLSGNKALP